MIVVPVKEGENIEKALKKFKRKLDRKSTRQNYSEKTIVSYGIDLTKFEEYFKKESVIIRNVAYQFSNEYMKIGRAHV